MKNSDSKNNKISQLESNELSNNSSSKKRYLKENDYCWFKCKCFIMKCFTSISNCCTSMHIYHQLLIYFVLLSIVILVLEILTHYACYHKIFKYDYMVSHTNEFLNSVLQEEIEQIIHVSTAEINNDFQEKVAPLLLLTILTKEFINHDLLKEKSFNELSAITEEYYKNINEEHLEYSIPEDIAEAKLDKNTGGSDIHLNELYKVHYIYSPLLIKSNSAINNHITNAYLGIYTLNSNNSPEHKYYFNFPVENRYNSYAENFVTNDFLIDPKICIGNCDYLKPTNDIYRQINWFSYKDLMFRNRIEETKSELTITSFIHFREDILTESSMNLIQFYIEYDNVPFVGNFFFKYDNNASHSAIDNIIDYSLFAIKHGKTDESSHMKYSDNETYVVTISDFTNIDQSEILNNFYRYTHKRKNNLFYSQGLNYDTFDLNLFSDTEKHFDVSERFKPNSKVFTNILLYALIPKIHNQKLIEDTNQQTQDSTYYSVLTNETQIRIVCSKFNFADYHDKSCFTEDELYFYKKANDIHYDKTKLSSYPKCECIPFYCLNFTESDIDAHKFVLADKLSLPRRCILNIDNYFFNREDNNNEYNTYDTYASFTWMPLPFLPELSVFIVSIVNNTLYNDINLKFNERMNFYLRMIILVSFITLILTFILLIIFFYIRLKKLSHVISTYMLKHRSFLFNTEDNVIVEATTNKSTANVNENIEEDNQSEDMNLIEKEGDNLLIRNHSSVTKRQSLHSLTSNNNNNNLSNENTLIDDLFFIYCTYYNLDPDKMQMKNKHENSHSNVSYKNKSQQIFDNKTLIMNQQNDLFDMLSSFSQNAPKYKFNISTNLNLYINSKFNLHFVKSCTKLNKNNSKQMMLTQGIIFELLSSENVNDYGFLLNMRFNYNDCIYVKSNDFIKKCIFNNTNREKEVKLVGRKKEDLFDILEANLESDEVFNLKMFESSFNYFLIHVYYKYYEVINEENANIV